MATRVLVWTETHVLGGCDRYLADLLPALDRDEWRVALARNPFPSFDAWLAERAPEVPTTDVPIASLDDSRLMVVRRAIGPAGSPAGGDSAAGVLALPEGTLPRRLGTAALRATHAATNFTRLRRLLRRARPDVLHINNGGYPGAESCRAAALAAKAEGVPRVVHFVHNMAFPPSWPHAAERRYDGRIDSATDAWMTAAGRASDALVAARGFAPERVHTVHYGLPAARPAAAADPAELGFADGALNLAVIAAFEPRKGHRALIEALDALRADGVEVRAALVGTGEERAAIEALVADRGLSDQVALLGWRSDVDAILTAADALVLPSLANECLPYAILEAMARGLPVVSTDVAGIPEEVDHGTTGLVVAPGDAGALAGALAELARAPVRAHAMGVAGRERVERLFNVPRMVARTAALWRGDPG